MAKRKNDTENTSVALNDGITEVETAKPDEIGQTEEVSDTIRDEHGNESAQNDTQSEYVIEMRHITKEFP